MQIQLEDYLLIQLKLIEAESLTVFSSTTLLHVHIYDFLAVFGSPEPKSAVRRRCRSLPKHFTFL